MVTESFQKFLSDMKTRLEELNKEFGNTLVYYFADDEVTEPELRRIEPNSVKVYFDYSKDSAGKAVFTVDLAYPNTKNTGHTTGVTLSHVRLTSSGAIKETTERLTSVFAASMKTIADAVKTTENDNTDQE